MKYKLEEEVLDLRSKNVYSLSRDDNRCRSSKFDISFTKYFENNFGELS